MKTNYYKILFLFIGVLLITAPTFANTGNFKGRYTKEKQIKKEFNVNKNALLKINNNYGNLDITSWNENRVVLVVTVRTNGNDEERVIDRLDDIDVEFESSSSLVSARTLIKNSNQSWWKSWLGSNNNVNMEINYTVKVPVTNDVDLNNDYGGIYLDRLEGQAKISCDYGKIAIGELLAENNYLNFDYTNNSTIDYMKSGKINADYSSFILEKSEFIDLVADYSKSEFGTIQSLNYNCDYGSVKAEKIGDVIGRGDYLSLRLGNTTGDINLRADYGSIKIENLTASTGDVIIQSDYTGIKIGYSSDFQFTFSIDLEYAGLSGEEDFEIVKKRIESSDKHYEGYRGSSSAKSNININSEYGGVSFNQNF